ARLEELEDTFGQARTPDTKPEAQQRSRSLSPTTSGNGPQAKEIPQEEPTRPGMHYLSIPVPGQQQRVSRTNERVMLPNQRDVSGARGVERMQRWGVTFYGVSDPLRFIEWLEERAVSHRVDTRSLAQGVPELLKGTAEDWFRTSHLQGEPWNVFRRELLDFFLPPRYFQRLEDEIRMRYQRENEGYKQYLGDIRLMMNRAGYSETQELERVYENLLPE
ncbi:Hypothetical predicted protein, partial [Drosophila guanche]